MKMGFEKCHPAVNFIYFVAVIFGTVTFQHPIFLTISFLCAFAYSARRNGWKAVVFDLSLLVFVLAYAVYYGTFHHFGVTNLGTLFTGNRITLESLVYGLVIGICVAGVMIWLSCVYSVFSSDKVVYLFGRVSPRLSLFLAITLRMVPRIKGEARKINRAQQGIGRGINQGNVLRRLKNVIRIFSMLITWTVESLATASESMRSRGSSLRGRKAFSIYRFDNRDRAYVIGVFFCLTVTLMALLLGQVYMQYDPRLVFPKTTVMSYVFYAGYAMLCLMPLLLELWTEHLFRRARRRARL